MDEQKSSLKTFFYTFASVSTCLFLAISCGKPPIEKAVAKTHGLALPRSARNFQHLTSGGFFDRGALAMFEIDAKDRASFLSQLKVNSRAAPTAVMGDPCLNGWNVWPRNSRTFVPGNASFDRLRKTWSGEAKPIEMLSCASPVGDWLHVEIWAVGETNLVKVYTDWN